MNTFRKFGSQTTQKMNTIDSKRSCSFSYLTAKTKARENSVKKAFVSKADKIKCLYQISSSLAKKDKDIEELQSKIERLTNEINTLQVQKMALNTKLYNINTQKSVAFPIFDTGSNFPHPSTIAKKWENFAKNDIINTFLDFEEYPDIVYTDFILHLTQEMFVLVQKLIKEQEENYYKKIAQILNLSIEDKKVYLQIKDSLNILIKENLDDVFNISTFYDKFLDEYLLFYTNFFNIHIEEFKNMLISEDFKKMVNNVKDLLLFFEFNTQKITLDIAPSIQERKYEIYNIKDNPNKRHYFNIFNDKVEKNENLLIILKPPLIKNKYLLSKDFQIIAMAINEGQIDVSNRNVSEFNEFHDIMSTEEKDSRYNLSININQSLEQNTSENSKEHCSSKEHCNTDFHEDKKDVLGSEYMNIEFNFDPNLECNSPLSSKTIQLDSEVKPQSPKGFTSRKGTNSNVKEKLLIDEEIKIKPKVLNFSEAVNKINSKATKPKLGSSFEEKTNKTKKHNFIEQAKKKSKENLKSALSYKNTNKVQNNKKYINHYGRKNLNKLIDEHTNRSIISTGSFASSKVISKKDSNKKDVINSNNSNKLLKDLKTNEKKSNNEENYSLKNKKILVSSNIKDFQNICKDKNNIIIKITKNKEGQLEPKRAFLNPNLLNLQENKNINNFINQTEDTCSSTSNHQEQNYNSNKSSYNYYNNCLNMPTSIKIENQNIQDQMDFNTK